MHSGLRTVKRDWSDNGTPVIPPAVNNVAPAPSVSLNLSPRSKRMAAIQASLDEMQYESQVLKSSTITNSTSITASSISKSVMQRAISSSSNTSKRSSPGSSQDADMSAKKRRVLPPSFTKEDEHKQASLRNSKPSSSRANIDTLSERTNVLKGERQKATAKPAAIFLSKEQIRILELVQSGHSVFYTGSAGTGKSVLLREIIKTMRRKYVNAPDAVAITASTGIAACNIGGVTIHSFSGIGLGVETAEQLATKIRKNKKAMSRWQRTKVLIIDEVSMVDGDLFDKLVRIGSILRKRTEPFGGIQVIVTGDFFQLPPVMKGGNPKFAFEAEQWGETIKEHTYNLTKVFRQKDQQFVDMLNEMRFGRLTSASINKFKSLSREIIYDDGMGATELFPRREDVDRSNVTRMQRLQTDLQVYRSSDGGTITDVNQREKMLANFMAPAELKLKVDAQVMLIKNLDETLVNGSMGRVVRFIDPAQAKDESILPPGEDGEKKKPKKAGQVWPVVAFNIPGGYIKEVMMVPESFKVELPNGEVQVSRTQLPLILAWAMSIHKSQGQTLERVKVDLGKVFEKGQAYVALSRATSLEGLQVLNFDPTKVMAHPKVVEWSKSLQVIS